jgi:hypothetical protein
MDAAFIGIFANALPLSSNLSQRLSIHFSHGTSHIPKQSLQEL